MTAPGSQPRAADVIVDGRPCPGLLDIVNAIVFWRLYSGTSATVILQSVAAGVQGKAAFAGVAYGLLTWIAMNYVIVPLSRASSPPFIMSWFIDGLLAHVLLVGLLFAFVARWSAARRTQA